VGSGEQDAVAPGESQVGFAASGSGLIAAWFDDIPAAVWMVEGPEHRVVGMNRAARVSFGDRSAVLGDPARETASDFLDQAMLARMDSVFASGYPMVEQDRSVTDRDAYGNPVELIVSVSIVPTHGSDGRVRGLVVQRLDVTQAARARQHAIEDVAELGARLDTSRDVVSTMQKVLLPGVLPLLPGLRLSARYRYSAGQGTGGDWFDAVPLAHDRVALVVGDVVGHGAAASAVMGQLRAVLMSYLLDLDGLGIGEAVARLDRFADRLPGARGPRSGWVCWTGAPASGATPPAPIRRPSWSARMADAGSCPCTRDRRWAAVGAEIRPSRWSPCGPGTPWSFIRMAWSRDPDRRSRLASSGCPGRCRRPADRPRADRQRRPRTASVRPPSIWLARTWPTTSRCSPPS
jgi:hypothetical protein